jgi:transketolase
MSLNKSLFLNSQLLTDSVESKSTRAGFGDALAELGAQNPNVVVLTADLNESTQTQKFSQKFPERFFDVGVAEQNMAGIAAGLALSGKIVFMSSYGVFSPGRNWDQIRVSICYSKANVKIVSSHTGLSAGPDGATHQALEDLALMRVLPNMTVIQPCDYESTKKAVEAAAKMAGPVYLRLVREKTPEITKTTFNQVSQRMLWDIFEHGGKVTSTQFTDDPEMPFVVIQNYSEFANQETCISDWPPLTIKYLRMVRPRTIFCWVWSGTLILIQNSLRSSRA